MLNAHKETNANVFIIVKSQHMVVNYSRVNNVCIGTPIKYDTQFYWSIPRIHKCHWTCQQPYIPTKLHAVLATDHGVMVSRK